MYHPCWHGLFTQAVVGLLSPTFLPWGVAIFLQLNGSGVTIHQQKLYGLCLELLEDAEVEGLRPFVVICLFPCCFVAKEQLSRSGRKACGMWTGKAEWKRLMCVTTMAHLIRQENNSTLWHPVSAHLITFPFSINNKMCCHTVCSAVVRSH